MSPEELDSQIRKMVLQKTEYERKLQDYNERLTIILSHQKTLVCALTPYECFAKYPTNQSYNREAKPRMIGSKIPFYLIDIGAIPNGMVDGFYSAGIIYPVGYRILRKYKKHIMSKSPHNEIFYTTVILSELGSKYYVISDDENNVCAGINAFSEFSSLFLDELPFHDIEDWLGLREEEVVRSIQELSGYTEFVSCMEKGTKSEEYLNRFLSQP